MVPSANHYSAANIKYEDIDSAVWELLGINEPTTSTDIYSIGTFRVRSVADRFEFDRITGMRTERLGGIIYVTFPIDNMDLVGETTTTMYIGKYNYNNDSNRWERFERMGMETVFDTEEIKYMDTWYAIERKDEDLSKPCPVDERIYKRDHKGVNNGFIASDHNCIMLVITDGHPLHDGGTGNLDEMRLDGIVTDPFSIGPVQFPETVREPPPPGGGGGGAIGSSDVLLLLTALGLLLVAGIVRRRRQSSTSIS